MDYLTQYYKELSETLTVQKQVLEAQIQEANIRSASEISTNAIETARKTPDPGGTSVQLSKKAASRVDDGQRLLKALADPSHEIHQNSEAKEGIVKVLGDLLHSANTRTTTFSGQPPHRGGAGTKDMKSAIRVLRNKPI